jgi:hypothetical protein
MSRLGHLDARQVVMQQITPAVGIRKLSIAREARRGTGSVGVYQELAITRETWNAFTVSSESPAASDSSEGGRGGDDDGGGQAPREIVVAFCFRLSVISYRTIWLSFALFAVFYTLAGQCQSSPNELPTLC